eukprot:1161923-Pelagomonas_calceolata.AAC.8
MLVLGQKSWQAGQSCGALILGQHPYFPALCSMHARMVLLIQGLVLRALVCLLQVCLGSPNPAPVPQHRAPSSSSVRTAVAVAADLLCAATCLS